MLYGFITIVVIIITLLLIRVSLVNNRLLKIEEMLKSNVTKEYMCDYVNIAVNKHQIDPINIQELARTVNSYEQENNQKQEPNIQ